MVGKKQETQELYLQNKIVTYSGQIPVSIDKHALFKHSVIKNKQQKCVVHLILTLLYF